MNRWEKQECYKTLIEEFDVQMQLLYDVLPSTQKQLDRRFFNNYRLISLIWFLTSI